MAGSDRVDSVDNDGSGSGAKSKRPKDSAFKQQRLPAWQPILTAGTVLPTFFVIGIAFIPIGIGMLWFSDTVKEHSVDYTQCKNAKDQFCHEVVVTPQNQSCICDPDKSPGLSFDLPEDMEGSVFVYYGLTNFYQNHRRYVKSRDDSQLLGNLGAKTDKVSSNCEPFDKPATGGTDAKYIPCGAIANSMFSDVINITFTDADNQQHEVGLVRTGIAWESDKKYKFKNPGLKEGQTLQQGKSAYVRWGLT